MSNRCLELQTGRRVYVGSREFASSQFNSWFLCEPADTHVGYELRQYMLSRIYFNVQSMPREQVYAQLYSCNARRFK